MGVSSLVSGSKPTLVSNCEDFVCMMSGDKANAGDPTLLYVCVVMYGETDLPVLQPSVPSPVVPVQSYSGFHCCSPAHCSTYGTRHNNATFLVSGHYITL